MAGTSVELYFGSGETPDGLAGQESTKVGHGGGVAGGGARTGVGPLIGGGGCQSAAMWACPNC